MRRPLLNLLMIFALLLQGVGSAWAATRMSAGEVAFAAHVAELPPCHQQQAEDEREASDQQAGMACCGTAACHCAMSCGAATGLQCDAAAIRFARFTPAIAPREAGALQAVFYGPPLRPPALS